MFSGYIKADTINNKNAVDRIDVLYTPNPVWAAQDNWKIDPISGNDDNSGENMSPLQTWREFQRRMKLVKGHSAAITIITIVSDLPDNDAMIIDWGTLTGFEAVYIHGSPTQIRTGVFTSTPIARNPSMNQPNEITDSSVNSWAGELGWNTGYQIIPTSGPAQNFPAWIVKDLGNHQARTSPFYDAVNFVDTTPALNDTYKIIKQTFVRNWCFMPLNGFWNINNLDLGDLSSTKTGFGYPDWAVAMQFTDCSVHGIAPAHTTVFFYNCCFKEPLNAYGATFEVYAGACGNIMTDPTGELEDGCDFMADNGFITQGVRHMVINFGYARLRDTGAFDSADYGWGVNSASNVRIQGLYGSGNADWGLYVGPSGTAFGDRKSVV